MIEGSLSYILILSSVPDASSSRSRTLDYRDIGYRPAAILDSDLYHRNRSFIHNRSERDSKFGTVSIQVINELGTESAQKMVRSELNKFAKSHELNEITFYEGFKLVYSSTMLKNQFFNMP